MRVFFTVLAIIMLGSVVLPSSAQFQGSSPRQPAPANPDIDTALLDQLLKLQPPELRFRRDDILSVSIFGMASFGGQQRVEEDGSIRFPFLDKVQVVGLTEAELEQSLESKLKAQKIIQDPQVTVTAVSQPWNAVTVSGVVQKPGVIPAQGDMTLIDYLSLAGGLQENLPGANLVTNSSASSIVTLIRPSIHRPVVVPLGPDPSHSPYARLPLFAGDVVMVGRVGLVYAVGAFKTQGAYPLKDTAPTTIIQLMAMAGGIGFEGDRKDARIIRTEGKSQYVLSLDIAKILKGNAADFALQANDILFVPTNEMKAAIKGGGTGYLVSVADAAAIAVR